MGAIRSSERDHSPRDMEPQHRTDLAARHGVEHGVADRDIEGGMLRVGVGGQGEMVHNQEDKESGVSFRGTTVGREPSNRSNSF